MEGCCQAPRSLPGSVHRFSMSIWAIGSGGAAQNSCLTPTCPPPAAACRMKTAASVLLALACCAQVASAARLFGSREEFRAEQSAGRSFAQTGRSLSGESQTQQLGRAAALPSSPPWLPTFPACCGSKRGWRGPGLLADPACSSDQQLSPVAAAYGAYGSAIPQSYGAYGRRLASLGERAA